MALRTLGRCKCYQPLGEIERVLCWMERWCLSTPVSPKNILQVAQPIAIAPPISVVPASLDSSPPASPCCTEWPWWWEMNFPTRPSRATLIALQHCLQPDRSYIHRLSGLDWEYMPDYDRANLVILKYKCRTQTNLIDEIACSYGTWDPKNHCSDNTSYKFQVSHRPKQRSQLLTRFPAELHSGLTCFKIWLSYKSSSAKVQIDYRLRYVHARTRAAHSKLPVDRCATRSL